MRHWSWPFAFDWAAFWFIAGLLCGMGLVALLLLAGCAPQHKHERVAIHARATDDRSWTVTVEAKDGCVLTMAVLPMYYREVGPVGIMFGRSDKPVRNDTLYSDTVRVKP